MTQPEIPLFDPANPPAGKVPAALTTGRVSTPVGPLGMATIRMAGVVTLQVLLDKDEAGQWAGNLAALRDSLAGSSLVMPSQGETMQIAQSARDSK